MAKITDATPVTTLDAGHVIPVAKAGQGPLRTSPEAILARTGITARVTALEGVVPNKIDADTARALIQQVLEDLGYVPDTGGGVGSVELPLFNLSPTALTIDTNYGANRPLVYFGDGFPAGTVFDFSGIAKDGRVLLTATGLMTGSTVFAAAGGIPITVTATHPRALNGDGTPVVRTDVFTLTITAAAEPEIPEDPGSLVFDYTKYERPVIGSGDSNQVYAPQMLIRAANSNELQGFAFNAGATALAASYGRFAFYIERGLLRPTDYLEYVLEGSATVYPVQFKVLRLHEDGSAAHIRVATMRPALNANQTIRAKLRKTTTAPSGSNVPMTAFASAPFTAAINVVGRYARDNLTVAPANQAFTAGAAALAASPEGAPYMQGPIMTEQRYVINLTDALRVVADARVYVDGKVEIDWQPRADLNMWTNPNKWANYTVNLELRQNGSVILSKTNFNFSVAQNGIKRVDMSRDASVNALTVLPEHNIQYDAPLLCQMGVFAPYDFTKGVSKNYLNTTLAGRRNENGFGDLLASNSVYVNIREQGAREDIGMVPGWNVAWLETQDYVARQVVLGTGDVTGTIPMNFWDREQNIRVTNFADKGGYPNLWADYRNSVQTDKFIIPDGKRQPWTYDTAHHPMLPYTPYLITGDRWYADCLEAHAMMAILYTWDFNRRKGGDKDWMLMRGLQPREVGWLMRDMGLASFLMPDSSALRDRFMEVADYSLEITLRDQLVWDPIQGEPHGWLAYVMPDDQQGLKPWMHDHIVAGVSTCLMAGSVRAAQYLDLVQNWHIGRRLQPDNILSYKVVDAFYYNMGSTHDILNYPPTVNTWAQFARVAAGNTVYENGWTAPPGNYAQLALRTVSLYGSLRKEPQADYIISRYIDNGAPFTDPSTYQRDLVENIRPLRWKAGALPTFVPKYNGSNGGSLAPTIPPTVASGQTFTASRNVTADQKVMTIAYTGGKPSGGTVLSPFNNIYDIRNGNELYTRTDLSAQSGTQNISLFLTNSGGSSSTVNVTGTITTTAPVTPKNIYGIPDADILGAYSLNRRIYSTYAANGEIARLQQDSDPYYSVSMTQGAATRQAYLDAAAGRFVGRVIWVADQSGNNRHGTAAQGTGFDVISNKQIVSGFPGFVAMKGSTGDVLNVTNLNPNGKGLGAAGLFMSDITGSNDQRLFCFLADGKVNDYDDEANTGLLTFNNKVGTLRNKAGTFFTTKSGAQITTGTPIFAAGAYTTDGGSYVNKDGVVTDGTSGYTVPFSNGTMLIGTRGAGSNDAYAGQMAEWVILSNPTKANVDAIYQNIKDYYGI